MCLYVLVLFHHRNQLKEAETEAATISDKMTECHTKIAENKGLMKDMGQ